MWLDYIFVFYFGLFISIKNKIKKKDANNWYLWIKLHLKICCNRKYNIISQ